MYDINGILPKIIKTIDTYSIFALSKNPIDLNSDKSKILLVW